MYTSLGEKKFSTWESGEICWAEVKTYNLGLGTWDLRFTTYDSGLINFKTKLPKIQDT